MPSEKALESRLKGILPVKDQELLKNLVNAKISKVQAKRIPLYEMSQEQREIVQFPLEMLREKGADVPEMDEKAMCITTGPNNLELMNNKGDVVSLTLTGNKIAYSINGSPRKEMSSREIELM